MEHVILWKSMVFALHNIDLLEHNYISFVIHYISISTNQFSTKTFFDPISIFSQYYLFSYESITSCVCFTSIFQRLCKLLFKTPIRVHYNLEYVINLFISFFLKNLILAHFEKYEFLTDFMWKILHPFAYLKSRPVPL